MSQAGPLDLGPGVAERGGAGGHGQDVPEPPRLHPAERPDVAPLVGPGAFST